MLGREQEESKLEKAQFLENILPPYIQENNLGAKIMRFASQFNYASRHHSRTLRRKETLFTRFVMHSKMEILVTDSSDR